MAQHQVVRIPWKDSDYNGLICDQDLNGIGMTRFLTLPSVLQVYLDSGAKKVLIPISSAAELGAAPSDLVGAFSLIFCSTPQEAVFKALGVE